MPRSDHFERFEAHTRLKHFLLDAYLKQWATILITRLKQPHRRGPRLWVIDGFAGAGRDETGAPGSPVIAAEIARQINSEHFASPLHKQEGMRVVAIEANPEWHRRLRDNMEPYTRDGMAFVRDGTLTPILDPLLRYISTDPAFFFLDPFGVDGLDASILPRLLEGPRTEILVLFADEAAVRLAGKSGAVIPTREELMARRDRDPSLFGEDFDAQLEDADREAVDRILAGHGSNPRATDILNTAFGGNWWERLIQERSGDERQAKFIELYQQVLRDAGASYVLRFDITTDAGRHKYTLLHASKHKRAFAAMKDAMHRARGQRPSAPALSLFGPSPAEGGVVTLDSGADLGAVAGALLSHFAGREVRWTGDSSRGTVQAYVLEETPLLLHEFGQLQEVLTQRGYVVSKRPLTYRFPAG